MKTIRGFAAIGALALLALAGCQNASSPTAGSSYKDLLYMTDTNSGKVYTYDPATASASSLALTATRQNATGELGFFGGRGYITVGSYNNSAPGLYGFDPSLVDPATTLIGSSISAQYLAFASSANGFVSSMDSSGTTSGLYSFDANQPGKGFAFVSASLDRRLQDLAIGKDGYLYAADNGNGVILRLDPASGVLKATISATAGGTTGLCAGSYGGKDGLFVASTGGYGPAPDYAQRPGSIDFVADDAVDGSSAVKIANATDLGASIYPARVIQVSGDRLLATGYGHTFRIDLSAQTPVAVEIMDSDGASFGSGDIAYKDGMAYVPVNLSTYDNSYKLTGSKNYLYVFDPSAATVTVTKVHVMTDDEDSISNIAFYE